MNDPAAKIGGIAAVGLQATICLLARSDARGRSTDNDSDPIRAIAFPRGKHGGNEAVGMEPAPREPIVSTIPLREARRERLGLESFHAPDPSGQRCRTEIIAREPRTAITQRSQRLFAAVPRCR